MTALRWLAIVLATIVVVDGDTVDVDGKRWRLQSFDTPETFYSRCAYERQLGERAKRRLQQLLDTAREIDTKTDGKRERWRRILGDVYVDGVNVGDILISDGLAVPYNGRGPRKDWCQGES